jgi:hypothetical protein
VTSSAITTILANPYVQIAALVIAFIPAISISLKWIGNSYVFLRDTARRSLRTAILRIFRFQNARARYDSRDPTLVISSLVGFSIKIIFAIVFILIAIFYATMFREFGGSMNEISEAAKFSRRFAKFVFPVLFSSASLLLLGRLVNLAVYNVLVRRKRHRPLKREHAYRQAQNQLLDIVAARVLNIDIKQK